MEPMPLPPFWVKVLNGTPKYCTPRNTIPFPSIEVASDYLFVQEITALLPIPFMVIGILTNLVFLFALIRVPSMRNAINFYLGNLAVIDVIFLTVVGGVYLDKKFFKPAVYHETLIGCYFASAADAFSFYAVLGIVTFGTVYYMCAQMSKKFAEGKGGTTAATLVTWILALGFGSIAAIQWGKVYLLCFVWPKIPDFAGLSIGYTKCASGPIEDANYALYLDLVKTVIFCIGFFVHSILYLLTCRKGSSDDANEDINRQVFRLLVVNGILFFLCQTPNRVLNILNSMTAFSGTIVLEQSEMVLLQIIGSVLLYFNAAIRPVIYAVCSGVYRRAYWRTFTDCSAEDDDMNKNSNVGIPKLDG